MRTGTLRGLIEQGLRLLDEHRLDELITHYHPDCVMIAPTGEEVGPDGIRQMLQLQVEAFPDIRHELVDAVEQGDKIAFILRLTGTHTGTFVTPMGPIEPTGRRISYRSCALVAFRGDKISQWNSFYDTSGIAAQLGLG